MLRTLNTDFLCCSYRAPCSGTFTTSGLLDLFHVFYLLSNLLILLLILCYFNYSINVKVCYIIILNLNTKKLIDFYKFNQHFHSIYCSNIIYVGAADSVHDKSKHIKTVQLSFDYNYYSTQQALYTTEILSGCKKFLRSRRLFWRLP